MRDRFRLGMVVFALARAGEALAGDPASMTAANAPDLNGLRTEALFATSPAIPSYTRPFYTRPLESQPLLDAPDRYPVPELSEPKIYSSKDFRPRGRSVYDVDPRSAASDENLTFDKTIWQRLNEYRTRDRVRVLTLWESGVSTVSLQTDRKGDPWLQFTSKLNTRGNAAHGLLDRLIPVTSFAGNGGHGLGRPAASTSPGKPSRPFSMLHFGSSTAP